MIFGGYDTPYELLREEITLCGEQGFSVPDTLKKIFTELDPVCPDETLLDKIYTELKNLPDNPAFQYIEPDDLEKIHKARPDACELPACVLSEPELLDKLHGAWLGRSVGCALGKPVEGMGMHNGQFRDIRNYLEHRSSWPLSDFIPDTDAGDGLHVTCELSTREKIAFMESDDDIRYTLVGLLLLEKYGRNFTSENIAALWNEVLPMSFLCTAERQALLNYNLSLHCGKFDKKFIRTFNNPYREWIGAQIRGDFFGFVSPGNPEQAAEFAWRDASWTHEKNGIYGEMFMAAVEASAFVESDPARLVEAGLAQIPANSRLASAIRRTLEKVHENPDPTAFMEWLTREYPMSAVHTINNAMICVMSLFSGKMNPDKCVCYAVSCGLDTDCNGATVGAITGIVSGAKNFGGTLAPRLHDTIRAEFSEFRNVTMTELAKRTLGIIRGISR